MLDQGLKIEAEMDVNNTVRQNYNYNQKELLSYFHLFVPLKQMCLSCQASPAGCNDGLLGYLSSESSAWDWRPETHNKDVMSDR